jgi:hypothetical protein
LLLGWRTMDDATLKVIPLMPCVELNRSRSAKRAAAQAFAYIGDGLTLEAFRTYAQRFDFGSIKPDQVVLHNTANPDATWAPMNADERIKWDRNEQTLSLSGIYTKRREQLNAIMRYYRDTLHWTAGPHLFVDDRWLWLFTPMDTIGVHAKEGNSYHDTTGRLHYTIGIEVVGWYGKVGWPASIQAQLRGAVQVLRDVLGTFQIVYKHAPTHTPAAHQGSIAFHRDYNKPECPGALITPEYAIPILAATPADPLKLRTLPGPNGTTFYCGEGFYQFYNVPGRGFGLFGYALSDERPTTDALGEACTIMQLERACMKFKNGRVELALLHEVATQGWAP